MRQWKDLSETERKTALSVARSEVLQRAVEWPSDYVCGDDEDLTERYERAVAEMERMQTPWFLHERLVEDERLSASINGLVTDYAERAFYPAPDEPVLFVNFRQAASVES
jgi:hypothetical protein